MTRPCRCLLADMKDEAELAALVRERIGVIPEEERTSEQAYALRLSRCRECEPMTVHAEMIRRSYPESPARSPTGCFLLSFSRKNSENCFGLKRIR